MGQYTCGWQIQRTSNSRRRSNNLSIHVDSCNDIADQHKRLDNCRCLLFHASFQRQVHAVQVTITPRIPRKKGSPSTFTIRVGPSAVCWCRAFQKLSAVHEKSSGMVAGSITMLSSSKKEKRSCWAVCNPWTNWFSVQEPRTVPDKTHFVRWTPCLDVLSVTPAFVWGRQGVVLYLVIWMISRRHWHLQDRNALEKERPFVRKRDVPFLPRHALVLCPQLCSINFYDLHFGAYVSPVHEQLPNQPLSTAKEPRLCALLIRKRPRPLGIPSSFWYLALWLQLLLSLAAIHFFSGFFSLPSRVFVAPSPTFTSCVCLLMCAPTSFTLRRWKEKALCFFSSCPALSLAVFSAVEWETSPWGPEISVCFIGNNQLVPLHVFHRSIDFILQEAPLKFTAAKPCHWRYSKPLQGYTRVFYKNSFFWACGQQSEKKETLCILNSYMPLYSAFLR